MKPRLAVSACLLGQRVRHDGGHTRDAFVTEALAPHVELQHLCPELEAGMSVPRPSVRLVDDGAGGARMVEPRSGADWTARVEAAAAARLAGLRAWGVHGVVLRRLSPSCGPRVPVRHPGHGRTVRSGPGLFAGMAARAGLDVEDDGRLHDPALRHRFLMRLFARARLDALFVPGWRPRDLIDFHAREKLLVLAHHPAAYRTLGALVAGAGRADRALLETAYRAGLIQALAAPAPRGRHANALHHAAGFLKRRLGAPARADLDRLIRALAAGEVAYVEPLTVLSHHVRSLGIPWLAAQTYFAPYPEPLLRATGVLAL